MAEVQTPTFKLVLVGDGGTGKVSSPIIAITGALSRDFLLRQLRGRKVGTGPINTMLTSRASDYLRQAPLDW